MKYCKRCNALLEDNVRYCNVCGGDIFDYAFQASNAYDDAGQRDNRSKNAGEQWQTGAYVESAGHSSAERAIRSENAEKLFNTCGVTGFIFSFLALIYEIIFVVLGVAFLMENPELLQTGMIDFTSEDSLTMTVVLGVMLLLSWMFTVLSVIFSAIGAGHRLRCRHNGFAYAGLIIGVFCLSVLVLAFGIGL